MSNYFLGEIRLLPYTFAPLGWMLCAGQLLPIAQNTALFSLLGTSYGGNGTSNFAVPDLRGRVPIHFDSSGIGFVGGEAEHTLIANEIPLHTHALMANTSTDAGSNLAQATSGTVLGNATLRATQGALGQPFYPYSSGASGSDYLSGGAVGVAGGSQPHNNRQPYLGLNICIAIDGQYPARN